MLKIGGYGGHEVVELVLSGHVVDALDATCWACGR